MNGPLKLKSLPAILAVLLQFAIGAAAAPAISAASHSEAAASTAAMPAKQVVVWDGEQANSGTGWVNPTNSTIRSQTAEAHSGNTAVEFKFNDSSGKWLGAGWNWCAFQTGPRGTDITGMKNFTLWIKARGKVADLQINLLCNGTVFDMPEHHTGKVSMLKYCPQLLDGEWHPVSVPLADLKQPRGFDPWHLGELQMFNPGAGDGSFFLDDLAFDDGTAPQTRKFIHPGLLNSKAELDFIKARIKAGDEPWAASFNRLKTSGYGNLNWTPHPLAVVNANGKDADLENEDVKAAYAQALLWYFTGNDAHARKSAEILDAWSGQLTNHVSTNHQNAVVAAWCGSVFPLAAEILRSSYPQWTTNETKQFSAMLNQAFLPLIFPGNAAINGNWEMSMSDALLGIGVFNEDAATFDRGVFLWRKRVPAYFYLATDGSAWTPFIKPPVMG